MIIYISFTTLLLILPYYNIYQYKLLYKYCLSITVRTLHTRMPTYADNTYSSERWSHRWRGWGSDSQSECIQGRRASPSVVRIPEQ